MMKCTSVVPVLLGVLAVCFAAGVVAADEPWIEYRGTQGPGLGKHIVLIAGDEEYRSEEALPQLGKILAMRHGFRCTVLFAINPADGTIDPMTLNNIPGLEALRSADLMIIATRFRDLPDEQMVHVADYLAAGGPVIGLRTATHAFKIPQGKKYSRFSFDSTEWDGGFGRQILGETWVAHHANHGHESTRGLIVDAMRDSPLVRGCEDIWGTTDVYTVRLPLPASCRPVIWGQVLSGMNPTDPPVEGEKNNPMMPVAWTNTYEAADGRTGRVFTTTMGAAVDLSSEGFRRLLVNAAYWCVGLEEKIPDQANVDLVGRYEPTFYAYGKFQPGVKPSDLALPSDWSPIAGASVMAGAKDVALGGSLGEAMDRGVRRLGEDPYQSPVYLRSDLTFEMKRRFTNFSGDVSGRFLEIASLTSPKGNPQPAALAELLRTVAGYQQPDGHFGREVDWSKPIDDAPDCRNADRAVRMPIFWGHSRLLMGLIEAHATFGDPKMLEAAKKLGDFYVNTADLYLDPNREELYKTTGTYSTAYVTCYFPALEGLVRLAQATGDERYLRHAERMAEFFKRVDHLPLDHSHGNLLSYHGIMLLYEATGKKEYLDRAVARWEEAMQGGYIWLTGGVGEQFRVCSEVDEGCSEADWLRLNFDLWRATGQTRFLDAAERHLENHYAMNRMPNGGYGHHWFLCDTEGPLVMTPKSVEAVWCCTFHGLLGMHALRGHAVVGTDRGVFVNLPIDVAAPVSWKGQPWKVLVERLPDAEGVIACRIRLEGAEEASPPPVFLRRPGWAETVRVTDPQGQPVETVCEGGYMRLDATAGSSSSASQVVSGETLLERPAVAPVSQNVLTVSFSFRPRVEDRRMQPLAIDSSKITRRAGVVLADGPCVLMANSDAPRPTLVLSVDKEGRPRLPASDAGVYPVATVDNLNVTDEQAREAMGQAGTLALGPWKKMDASCPTALVFDVIVVPAP